MGTNHIWVGDVDLPFSESLTRCSAPFYDTGFQKMTDGITDGCTGKVLVIRRDGPPSTGEGNFTRQELRLYQTPNLLQELESAGVVTISAPAPDLPEKAATNLITHLATRTAGNNFKPLIDKLSNRAAYNSCYKTTNV